jgi:acetyltransferase-like isoleucine patch superfamily enzyme
MFNRDKFAFLAPNAFVQKLLRIEGKENIYIGENVVIQKMTWLAAVPITKYSRCCLKIEKGSIIGNFNHIYATECIHIEENVLIADKVYIADNLHQYTEPYIPIMKQPILQLKSIKIGSGSWIGENVCIIGANIGKHCIIGANAVVTNDIPDYSVAVGIPAKVIKRYNHQMCQWERT